jgi:hypothetical protein
LDELVGKTYCGGGKIEVVVVGSGDFVRVGCVPQPTKKTMINTVSIILLIGFHMSISMLLKLLLNSDTMINVARQ